MKKTIILLTLLALSGCKRPSPTSSDNDSPIIVSDSSTTIGGTVDKMAAITVGRQNVNFWSKPFYGDGKGGYTIYGRTLPLIGYHYQGTCVEGMNAGKDVWVTLAPKQPWSVDFQDGHSASVFTVNDTEGDDNEILDPKGATLEYSGADNKGNTLITGTKPKAFTQALVTSNGKPTPIMPKIDGQGNAYVTIHYCPKGICSNPAACQ